MVSMETLKTMSTAVTTNLDDAVAARAREVGQREPRSISNLGANAVAMFTRLARNLGMGFCNCVRSMMWGSCTLSPMK
jgi:hypothetical protein